MLDFSDRTRTGISKLISRCALSTGLIFSLIFYIFVKVDLLKHTQGWERGVFKRRLKVSIKRRIGPILRPKRGENKESYPAK